MTAHVTASVCASAVLTFLLGLAMTLWTDYETGGQPSILGAVGRLMIVVPVCMAVWWLAYAIASAIALHPGAAT